MQGYVTGSLLAAGIAFIISLAMGPVMIPLLTRLKVGQRIREEGPMRHYSKAGTPTMGGVIIITAVMIACLVLAGTSTEVLCAVLVMLAYSGIGFWDDYIKVVLKRSLGLRAREKLGLQIAVSTVFALLLLFYFDRGTALVIPFSGKVIDLGIWYIPFIIIVFLSCSNGANLTDGLDGLAAGVTFFIAAAFTLVSFMTSQPDLAIFCASLAGACVGFLIFNHYPARVFMGDTGSMALGGAVAAIAAFCRVEVALLIFGGVYVIETLSVILQVVSYQSTHKRIFLMAPLHHHYELKGWTETKVVKSFWLASLLCVIIGILSVKGLG